MSPAHLKLASARRKLRGYDVGGAVKAVRNFLTGVKGSGLDRALEDLKRTVGDAQPIHPGDLEGADAATVAGVNQSQAMHRWIDRNLRNYLIKQHGTENDPLKAMLGDQYQSAITKRNAAEHYASEYAPMNSGYQVSDTPPEPMEEAPSWFMKLVQKDWPRWADERAHARDIADIGYTKDRDDLAQKLGGIDAAHTLRNTPPVEMYDIGGGNWSAGPHPLGRTLRDTLDYLRANVDPRSLPQVSVPDAVRKSQEWHASMAKKAAEANQELINQLPVTKQYQNGAKWVRVGDAGNPYAYADEATQNAAQSIGKSLGHCYQDPATCQAYLSNGELHTLIDANGKPRVTMEMSPASARMHGVYQADVNGKPLMDIGQIHGPQFKDREGPLDEDTIPYVKDYISSMPNVTSIGDKQDVLGLKKFSTQGGFPRWLDPSTIPSEMARYRYQSKNGPQLMSAPDYQAQAVNDILGRYPQKAQAGVRPGVQSQVAKEFAQRYKTPADADFYQIPDDFQPPSDVGMAGGGLVDQAGVYAGDLADAARALLSRVKSGTHSLADELTGSVEGGHEAERVLPKYGSRTKQANEKKLPGLKDKTVNNLVQMGIVNSPEEAHELVDSMTRNDDPLIAGAALGDEALESVHHAEHTQNSFDKLANNTEDANNLPPGLLHRLIKRESNWNPLAVSKAGAIGIAQFMPATAASMGIDPTDPSQAIPAAGQYLRSLYEKTGNWRDALASYNWGLNNVLTYGYGHAPSETKKYVRAIMGDDAAGAAIARAKRSLSAQQTLTSRGVLPQSLGDVSPTEPPPFPDVQGDQSQTVPRGTELLQAKRLTAPGSSSRMLSELDPGDALEFLLAVGGDDQEDSDGLLGLLALLEGFGAGGQGEAAQ